MASCRFCRTKTCGVITIVTGVFMVLAGGALLGGFIAFTKNSVTDVSMKGNLEIEDGMSYTDSCQSICVASQHIEGI